MTGILTDLWFIGTADCREKDNESYEQQAEEIRLPVFEETARWLDIYFSGRQPDFLPSYKINNLTEFRKMVINQMMAIPYGETVTYGKIARKIAAKKGLSRMSAQAVGGAVGWNPLCILIPCHRVVGTDGSLTGYGGGIENKVALLRLEGVDMNRLHR